ncbi:hypothetical protein LCGC14_2838510, partial [marine sediment metagenome]
MRPVVTVVALAGLLVSAAAGPPADGGRPALRAQAGPWGRIEAGFAPRVTRAVVGEPVFFDFVVRNVGGGKIAFEMGGDSRGSIRHNRFTVVVRSPGQGARPLPDPQGYSNGGGVITRVTLEGGEEYRQSLLLQNWADLRLPPDMFPKVPIAGSDAPERKSEAVLAVTAAYTLPIRPSRKSDATPTPVHVTDGFLLRLRPADEKSMAAVVRRFSDQCGSKDRTRRRNAYTALGMIRRPDAVDGLLSALAKANTDKRTDDAEAIVRGLEEIRAEIERDEFPFHQELEDIHLNIEARLKEKIGEAAGRLHTARSRNDQIATDMRLYVMEACDRAAAGVRDVQAAL